MRLRPYAPLVVVGAGLLIMTVAPHAASADDRGAPSSVLVNASGADLVVTWEAPSSTDGLTGYDVTVADPADHAQVLDRTLDAGATQSVLHAADLGGRTDLLITVASEYGGAQPLTADPVRVTLPTGPAKPEAAPTLRLEGRRLTVQLPAADTTAGLTGRVVRIFRDGGLWKEVSLQGLKATVSRRAATGPDYTAAYARATAGSQSAFSEQSDSMTLQAAGSGPGAVRTIRLKSASAGLQVHWSEAASAGSDLSSYRVRVLKAGKRVGSAFTASSVRTVVLPGETSDGSPYSVTVTAVDAAGRTSSTTTTLSPKR